MHIAETTANIPTKFFTFIKPANTIHGWYKHAYNKSTMADGRYFAKKSIIAMCQQWYYHHEIWYDDEH